MSPLFRRNRKNNDAPGASSAPSPQEVVSPLSAPSAQSAMSPISAPSVPSAPEPPEQDGPSMTRVERISTAYAQWHDELETVAAQVSRPSDAHDPAIVDLSHPHPTGASQLYSGMPTLISSLVREETTQQRAKARLGSLRAHIEDLSEQYGYAPITLAIDRMSWTEINRVPTRSADENFEAAYTQTGELNLDDIQELIDDAGKAHAGAEGGSVAPDDAAENAAAAESAPAQPEEAVSSRTVHESVLLRGARLEPSGEDDAYITLTSRCEINPAIVRALRDNGTRPEELSKLRTFAADVANLDETLRRIRELGRAYLPGFSYEECALLGSFIHPGQVLLADLEAMKPYIETSGIMAALAGDADTRKLSSAPLPPAEKRDRAPEAERGAGDHDPAELAVVEAVASGRSIVVDTPPGSQSIGTLAAIVADAAASGRSVLYVPGRASAARALIDELERLGLGDVVLDFSDLDGVAKRVRTGLRLREGESDINAIIDLRQKLSEARIELSDYIDSVHEVDPRWQRSLHSVLEQLADVTSGPNPPQSRVRVAPETLDKLVDDADAVRERFEVAADLGAFADSVTSPWTGADIHSAEAGEKAMARVNRLASETIPVVMAQSQRAAGETGLTAAVTFASWIEQIHMLTGISRSLDVFLPQIFERSAQDMVIATATKEWREKHGESMKGSERRRLTKQARDLLRPGAQPADLHEDLATVQRQREVWRRYCTEGGWPKLPEGMSQIRISAEEADQDVLALEEILPGEKLRDMPLGNMLARLRSLAADTETMDRLPKANETLDSLREDGFEAVIDDFCARAVSREQVGAELELIFASSVFEQLVGRSPALATTTPADLARLAKKVRELDEQHVSTLAGPVSRAVVRIMRETISKRREETLKLDAQLDRYSTGALREAIATYPRLVQVSRPVWVIPSMMTAEFIPPMPWADIVVMDELDAAGLAPAVSMLMRGRQIVVMGNVRRSLSEGADTAIGHLSKVLPVCELPTLRAQHDELATQTLREQGYADVLQMIPAAKRGRRPRLVVVDGRGVPGPQNGMVEGPQAEITAAVDAVVDHVLSRPDKSLAVVTVSPIHAARVRETLKKLSADSPQLSAFLRGSGTEPFQVLELTQTGGLRRDSVILSVGIGKTVHGRVLHTFGPLATPSGLTGLVDAVEAAREELTIISSLGPGEIGSDRLSTPGPRLLERLIERADGREVRLDPASSGEPVGPLLADLASRIRAEGFEVASSFGYDDGVRIPLVAGDPSLEGTWRVAVVVDDDEYVAERSMRRRDRYWLERLEARGWRVIRTFSTSLFIDPAGQAQLVLEALRAARAEELPSGEVSVPVLPENWSATTALEAPDELLADRGVRPVVESGLPLAAYTDDQLDDMVDWIASDGVERSRPELIDALRTELAIERRGAQIDAILGNVVDRSGRAVSLNLGAENPEEEIVDTSTITLADIEPVTGVMQASESSDQQGEQE